MTGRTPPPWPRPCRPQGWACWAAACARPPPWPRPLSCAANRPALWHEPVCVQATPTPDEATFRCSDGTPGAVACRAGLVPQRPTQWCEDFAAQFDALVACAGRANFTFGILDARNRQRLHSAGCTVIGTATTVQEALPGPEGGRQMRAPRAWRRTPGHLPGRLHGRAGGTLALVPQLPMHRAPGAWR